MYRLLWRSSSSIILHEKGLFMYSSSNKGLMLRGGGGGGGGGYRRLPSSPACYLISTTNNKRRYYSAAAAAAGLSMGGMMTKRGFPQIPLLCLSPTSDGRILPAFDPSHRCFYDIPIPKEVQGPDNSVRGAGHGWLVMVKSNIAELDHVGEPTEMILSLYNPITRAHIPLPSVPPSIVGGDAQVWCNPTHASPGQPLVSIMYGLANRQILIYEQGDDYWSREIVTPLGDRIASTVYHEAEDALYVVYVDGRLSVLDPASSWTTLRSLIDTPFSEMESSSSLMRMDRDYYSPSLVVGGVAGDLLLVMSDWPRYKHPFDVLKLDRGCRKWVKTTTSIIGDHTLFMYDDNNIVSMICNPGITDAQANQIYIFNQHRTYSAEGYRQVEDTDTNIMIEVSGDVQVCDLIKEAKSVQKDQQLPSFETSKILRGPPLFRYGYMQFAAWMVPSLS